MNLYKYLYFNLGDNEDSERIEDLEYWKEKSSIGSPIFTGDDDMDCTMAVSIIFIINSMK